MIDFKEEYKRNRVSCKDFFKKIELTHPKAFLESSYYKRVLAFRFNGDRVARLVSYLKNNFNENDYFYCCMYYAGTVDTDPNVYSHIIYSGEVAFSEKWQAALTKINFVDLTVFYEEYANI